jgi:hypothetical protein
MAQAAPNDDEDVLRAQPASMRSINPGLASVARRSTRRGYSAATWCGAGPAYPQRRHSKALAPALVKIIRILQLGQCGRLRSTASSLASLVIRSVPFLVKLSLLFSLTDQITIQMTPGCIFD